MSAETQRPVIWCWHQSPQRPAAPGQQSFLLVCVVLGAAGRPGDPRRLPHACAGRTPQRGSGGGGPLLCPRASLPGLSPLWWPLGLRAPGHWPRRDRAGQRLGSSFRPSLHRPASRPRRLIRRVHAGPRGVDTGPASSRPAASPGETRGQETQWALGDRDRPRSLTAALGRQDAVCRSDPADYRQCQQVSLSAAAALMQSRPGSCLQGQGCF